MSESLLALIYPMILGLDKIEVSALLNSNGVFQAMIGLPSFPNPTTLRRFLIRSAPEVLNPFRTVHDDLRKQFLVRPTYLVDFDSTARTLYGHQEGAVKGYNPEHKGKRSYHPLVANEAHLRDCLGGFLRPGDAYSAEGIRSLLEIVCEALPFTRGLRIRADEGFYGKEFVFDLEKRRIGYAIVARMTAPIKRTVPGLRYHRINPRYSASEFLYEPTGWKEPHRFAVLRREVENDPDEELTLFTLHRYAYSVIVTNLSLTPYGVFTFYKDRAALERIIRILKNDFPFGSAPTADFTANTFYAELSLLAYNLVIRFKRLCLPEPWQSFTLPTLRHRLFMIPAEFVRTDSVPTLKFCKNHPYRDVFEYAQKRIKKLKPLT